jgi:predicted ATPase/DNA-binding SARP family transcriptional activator
MAAPSHLQLLGQPRLTRQGAPDLTLHAKRPMQLLALLGFEGQCVPRSRLARLFWPGRDERSARSNLRKVLLELRALHIAGIEETPAGLCWLPSSDVQVFRAAWLAGDWSTAAVAGAGQLMQGLDGTRGSEAFDDWLRRERAAWQARWREAALKALAAAEAQGRADLVLALAQQLLQADARDAVALAASRRAAAALGRPELGHGAWRHHPRSVADPAAASLPQGRLAPLSPLVGRQQELQALAALLGSQRLVTLFGPGGVGKTRLARHAADALATRYAQGAVWVAVAGLETPAALPARIAEALGLALTLCDHPADALARLLAPRQMLLVLDGFEPLIDAAGLLLRLLAAAPGLHLLVSSRERLEVDGEWLLPVGGLAVPPAHASAEEALASEAVMLFAARARAVNPAFEIGPALGPVAEICRCVEGLPLALELAASWVRLMPVERVAQELSAGMACLSPGRHGGLRAVFESSWQLLTSPERQAYARLAVFRGGFTRAAAEQVAEVPLALLAALVDKSMLRAHADGRFDMHPVLYDCALEKRAALPQAAVLAECHSRWYLATAPRPDLPAERQNLLAALRHAVVRRDAAAVEAAVVALPWARVLDSRLDDGIALLDDAGAAFSAHAATAAHLRAHRGWLLLWLGRHDEAQVEASIALQTLRHHDHAAGTVTALRTLAHAARLEGRYQHAADTLASALACAERAGLARLVAMLQDALAMVMLMRGEYAAARAQVLAALAFNRACGDDAQGLHNELNLSQSHALAGDAAAALPWAQAGLASAQRQGVVFMLPYAHAELATVQQALGQTGEAAAQAELALQRAHDTADRVAQAVALTAQARIAVRTGDLARARHCAAAAAGQCLAGRNLMVSAALVPVAASAWAGERRAARWLATLLALPELQVPARDEALALLAGTAPAAPAAGSAGGLRELLADIETPSKRPPH